MEEFFQRLFIKLKVCEVHEKSSSENRLKSGRYCDHSYEHLPRNMWRLKKVLKTFTGRVGLTRSCEIKTQKGVIKRPLQLLVKLECYFFSYSV